MEFAKNTDQNLILLEGDGIYDERVLKKLLTSTHSLYITNRDNEEWPIAIIVQPDHRHYLNTNTIRIEKILQGEVQNDWLKTISIYDMDSYIPELRQTAVPLSN